MAPTEPRIRFTTAGDGTRIAYATHGGGYPLVRSAHPPTHLQHEWESPVWHAWLAELGRRFTVVRYDERGCGLSDRDVDGIGPSEWTDDLAATVDAAGLGRFALLGTAHGAAAAISYAARHPERVSHLVIFGGSMLGNDHLHLTDLQREEAKAIRTLIRVGWERDDPSVRRFLTSRVLPDADEDLLRANDALMRRTTSAQNAARFDEAFDAVDLTALATHVRVPTLVLHLDEDRVVPFASGRAIASAIPAASFVPLHGRNHVPQPTDDAWPRILELIEEFIGAPRSSPHAAAPLTDSSLSTRELEVLDLVAGGRTNQEIAAALTLSVRTVERHLSNVYLKMNLAGKAARAAAAARATELRLRTPPGR